MNSEQKIRKSHRRQYQPNSSSTSLARSTTRTKFSPGKEPRIRFSKISLPVLFRQPHQPPLSLSLTTHRSWKTNQKKNWWLFLLVAFLHLATQTSSEPLRLKSFGSKLKSQIVNGNDNNSEDDKYNHLDRFRSRLQQEQDVERKFRQQEKEDQDEILSRGLLLAHYKNNQPQPRQFQQSSGIENQRSSYLREEGEDDDDDIEEESANERLLMSQLPFYLKRQRTPSFHLKRDFENSGISSSSNGNNNNNGNGNNSHQRLSLSVVNNMDVLRSKLLRELAQRQQNRLQQTWMVRNREIFKQMG